MAVRHWAGMSNMSVVIWAWIALAAFLAYPPTAVWWARRRQPWAISERLLRGDAPVRIRTTFAAGAWNPAKAGRDNRTAPVRGIATYRLSPEGLVVLDLRCADGTQERFVGPPVTRPARAADRSASWIVGGIVLVYAAAAALGALVGHVVGDGQSVPTVAGGALGVVTASLILAIASQAARRRRRRDVLAE